MELWHNIREYDKKCTDGPFTRVLSKKRKQYHVSCLHQVMNGHDS